MESECKFTGGVNCRSKLTCPYTWHVRLLPNQSLKCLETERDRKDTALSPPVCIVSVYRLKDRAVLART